MLRVKIYVGSQVEVAQDPMKDEISKDNHKERPEDGQASADEGEPIPALISSSQSEIHPQGMDHKDTEATSERTAPEAAQSGNIEEAKQAP